MNTVAIHKLTEMGLGQAPFRIVGFYKLPSASLAGTNPFAYEAILASRPKGVMVGSCAMCGTGLTNNFIIKSADGKKHSVGCDCVEKINDVRLTNDIKELKRKARLEAKLIKAEEKRVAYQAAYQATLQEQRDRNNGLTNYELVQEEIRVAEALRVAPIVVLLAPLANEIEDGKRGFCDSIAESMRNGLIPSGRGLDITLDILSKNAGRANSKAYWARYQELEDLFFDARNIIL